VEFTSWQDAVERRLTVSNLERWCVMCAEVSAAVPSSAEGLAKSDPVAAANVSPDARRRIFPALVATRDGAAAHATNAAAHGASSGGASPVGGAGFEPQQTAVAPFVVFEVLPASSVSPDDETQDNAATITADDDVYARLVIPSASAAATGKDKTSAAVATGAQQFRQLWPVEHDSEKDGGSGVGCKLSVGTARAVEEIASDEWPLDVCLQVRTGGAHRPWSAQTPLAALVARMVRPGEASASVSSFSSSPTAAGTTGGWMVLGISVSGGTSVVAARCQPGEWPSAQLRVQLCRMPIALRVINHLVHTDILATTFAAANAAVATKAAATAAASGVIDGATTVPLVPASCTSHRATAAPLLPAMFPASNTVPGFTSAGVPSTPTGVSSATVAAAQATATPRPGLRGCDISSRKTPGLLCRPGPVQHRLTPILGASTLVAPRSKKMRLQTPRPRVARLAALSQQPSPRQLPQPRQATLIITVPQQQTRRLPLPLVALPLQPDRPPAAVAGAAGWPRRCACSAPAPPLAPLMPLRPHRPPRPSA
jgi:hypothetical protein